MSITVPWHLAVVDRGSGEVEGWLAENGLITNWQLEAVRATTRADAMMLARRLRVARGRPLDAWMKVVPVRCTCRADDSGVPDCCREAS